MTTLRRTYSVVVFIVLASLDNVAIGLVPPLYNKISTAMDVSAALIGVVTAVSFLVSAIAAVGWAYVGDRTRRKPILMIGTLIWAAGTLGTGLSGNYLAFFAAQMLAAVGLGAVGSVGFSVVSDLIAPRRRGLVMSFWGLSQGIGTLAGGLLGGLLGATDWRRPFFVLTAIGLVATLAYGFTSPIRRGQAEPELAQLYAAGGEYDYRISRADLKGIVRRRTNIWLILQGFLAQFAFGSLVWLPVLYQEKAENLGFAEAPAIQIGALFATLLQVGGVLSIVGGIVGDRVQRRRPGGRALVAAVGVLAAVPFYLVLFFMPLRIDAPPDANTGEVVSAVLSSVVTEPTVGLGFLIATVALALTSTNAPNWFALVSDVNPPEHRGTVYSLVNLVNGAGRFGGNSLTGVLARGLAGPFPPPANYAIALTVFQLFFIPTGVAFLAAARSSPKDIADVRETLRARAEESPVTGPESGSPAARAAGP